MQIKSLLLALMGCLGIIMSHTPNIYAAENTAKEQKTSPAAVAPAMLADKAHISILKNGLTVYILPDTRFPLVSTRLYVRAGSAYETPEDAGISHVLEHMVFKGTSTRPMGAISQEVEAVGGYLNAATSFDYTVYLTDMPSDHWQLGMDVVKDMAFNATLDAKELASEKEVVLSELQRSNDNPGQLVFKSLQGQTLKNTSYERPIIGFEETINAITPESMRAYIAKYYQPQNMLLVVVGNIDAKAVLQEAEKLFGTLENTAPMQPVQLLQANTLQNSSIKVMHGAWNKIYLSMALPVPGLTDVQSLQLDILAHVLGGDATSYLYKKYKYEKQLVDAIGVGNYSFERIGMLYFTVQLDMHKLEPFWKEFVADLASLKATAFNKEDIARAQLLVEDGIYRSKETLGGLASWRGYLELFLGGEQGEKNMLNVMNEVTQEQLQKSLDTWLVPERFNVAVLAPQHAVLPDLQSVLHKNWPVPATAKKQDVGQDSGKSRVIDLGDGRQVVLIPDATMPYTSVDLYMTGGDSLAKNYAEQGLAALTAQTLTTGTTSMTSPQMEEFLAARAASLRAFSGRQSFGFSMSQPSRFNADLFALLKDIITKPALSQEEVERERKNQISAIRSRDDKPLGFAFSKMPSFLFGTEHPYAFTSLGEISDVEKYTQAMVKAFWQKQSRQPWVLSVAGDFDEEAVLAFARSLPKPQDAAMKINPPQWTKPATLPLTMEGREQAHLMLVFKTVPADHEDAVGLELLQTALAGQSGLLFRELRDKQGLGYTVTAFPRFMPEAGYMVFYIGTEPGKMEQAEKGFKTVIESLRKDPLPQEEVQKAKNKMQGDYYRDRQSLGSRSGEGGLRTLLGQDLDFRVAQIEKAKTLKSEDLRDLARKYLQLENVYTMKLKP